MAAALIGLIASACTHEMALRADRAYPDSIAGSKTLKNREVILVVGPELREYRLTKEAYNWAGGNLAPDHITFNVGEAFSLALIELCNHLFLAVDRSDSFREARGRAKTGQIIILPEIGRTEMFLPSIRFNDIQAEVMAKYSFYDDRGNLIDSKTVVGRGTKSLTFTKENYRIAMESALRDLIRQSNEAFLSLGR